LSNRLLQATLLPPNGWDGSDHPVKEAMSTLHSSNQKLSARKSEQHSPEALLPHYPDFPPSTMALRQTNAPTGSN
jgi:hypothetical protein